VTRRTVARVWTEAEHDLAGRIVRAVYAASGGLVGGLTIARAVGLPYGPRRRSASLRRIYDVMPLAVLIAQAEYPGSALLVQSRRGGALYSIGAAQGTARNVTIDRAKRVHTSAARMGAEVEPLRGSTELVDVVLVNAVDMALQALSSPVLDAVAAHIKESAP
jgi:hypothetical protein